MPTWAEDAGDFWKATDAGERENGRLFQQIVFALPNELNQNQQLELTQAFAEKVTGQHQLPFSFAVHDPGDGNPHCHLIFSERMNDGISRTPETWFKRGNKKNPERGGAIKTRHMKDHDWLPGIRKTWEQQVNDALAAAGKNTRVDCRTLEAQGISRRPQKHWGPNVLAMEKRTGMESEKRQEYERMDKLDDFWIQIYERRRKAIIQRALRKTRYIVSRRNWWKSRDAEIVLLEAKVLIKREYDSLLEQQQQQAKIYDQSQREYQERRQREIAERQKRENKKKNAELQAAAIRKQNKETAAKVIAEADVLRKEKEASAELEKDRRQADTDLPAKERRLRRRGRGRGRGIGD